MVRIYIIFTRNHMPFDIEVVTATDDQRLLIVDLTKTEINEKSIRHLASLNGKDNKHIGMITLTGEQLSQDTAHLLSVFIYDTPTIFRISLTSDLPYRNPDERLLHKAFNTYVRDLKQMYCMFIAAKNRKMPYDMIHLIFSFLDPKSERILFNDRGLISVIQSRQYLASIFGKTIIARPSLEYALQLKSDNSEAAVTAAELEKNTLYVGSDNGNLTYSVVTPGGRVVQDIMTDIPAPEFPLTLHKLKPLKAKLLDTSCNARHTRPLSLREQVSLSISQVSIFRQPAPQANLEKTQGKLCVGQ